MEESRQNAGENVGPGVTPAPEDALEYVLDAWSSEPSTRQRYDRLTLERRDGKSLAVLVDAETARDVADKLTIVAARARHRSRGAAGVPVDRSVDPGNAEDVARARKVIALLGLEPGTASAYLSPDLLGPLVEEFKASREDVAKAHAMLDEQREKHIRDMAAIAKRHVDAAKDLEIERDNVSDYASKIRELEAELESVKADRANLIAEAAERDIAAAEDGDEVDPVIEAVGEQSITFGPNGDVPWSDFKATARAMKKRGLNPTNGEVFAEARRLRAEGARSSIDLTDGDSTPG